MTSVSLEERVRKLERDRDASKDILWTLFTRLCRLENLMSKLGLLEVDTREVRDDVLLQIEKRVAQLESGIAAIAGGIERPLPQGRTLKNTIDPPPVCRTMTNGNAKESRNPDMQISNAVKFRSTDGNPAALTIKRNGITSLELGAESRSSMKSSDQHLEDEDYKLCERDCYCSHQCDGSHTWSSLCPPCKVVTDVKFKCGHEMPAVCDLCGVLSQSGCGFCSGLKQKHLDKMMMEKLDSLLGTKLKAVHFSAFEEVMENVNRMGFQKIMAAIKHAVISDGSNPIAKKLFHKIVVDDNPIEPSITVNLLKNMGSDSTSPCKIVVDELVDIVSKRFHELFRVKSERYEGSCSNSSAAKMTECTRLIWLIGQLFCVDGLTFMHMMDIIDSLNNVDSSENIGHLCTLLELNGRKFHECMMSKNRKVEFPTQYLCILWLRKVYEDLVRVSDEIVADPVTLSRVQNLLHLEQLRTNESKTLGEGTTYTFGKDVDLMPRIDSRTEDVAQISTESWEKQMHLYSTQQRNPSEAFRKIQENTCQLIPASPNKPSIVTAKDLFAQRVQLFSWERLQQLYRTYTTSNAKDRLECTVKMLFNLTENDVVAFIMEYPYYFFSMLEAGVVCDAVQFLRDVVLMAGVGDVVVARSMGRFVTDSLKLEATKKLRKFLFHVFAHEHIIDINRVSEHVNYERMEDWQKLRTELQGKVSSHLDRKRSLEDGMLKQWRAT